MAAAAVEGSAFRNAFNSKRTVSEPIPTRGVKGFTINTSASAKMLCAIGAAEVADDDVVVVVVGVVAGVAGVAAVFFTVDNDVRMVNRRTLEVRRVQILVIREANAGAVAVVVVAPPASSVTDCGPVVPPAVDAAAAADNGAM